MSTSAGFPDFDFPQPRVAPASGTNLLRTGLAWLTDQLKTYASEAILYVDREGNRIECRATLGKKLLKFSDGMGGFYIQATDLDFLIKADDLAVNGARITPVRGDQIYLTIGANVEQFEVGCPNDEPHWRWADPHESLRRVHTNYVSVEPYA